MRSTLETCGTMPGQGGMREAGVSTEELEAVSFVGSLQCCLYQWSYCPQHLVYLMHSCMHSYMYPHLRRAGYGDLMLVLGGQGGPPWHLDG